MVPMLYRAIYNLALLAQVVVEDSESADFNDLGKLLLGGFAAAVGVALLLVFIRLRFGQNRSNDSNYISITSLQDK